MGFRMVVGGGLGSAPRIAHLLREFVPMDELLPTIEAVIRVFDSLGNRKNRSKARMKFVIDKLGFEEFTKRWAEAYQSIQKSQPSKQPLKVLTHEDSAPLIMPASRKFKIAFSGCRHDCALTPIHDIGLLAAKAEDGTMGFRMVVGGGLGSAPRIAHLLREFVPMDELLPTIEAVIRVFDSLGNRKNRSKARMKFVIDKLGFEEFTKRWAEAYQSIQKSQPSKQPLKVLTHEDSAPLIMPSKSQNGSNGHGTASTPFDAWKRTNVVKQKQEGFVAAVLKLPMGDITTDQMLAVADLADTFSNGNIRTTINQNLIIRWVPESKIQELYHQLAEYHLVEPGAELIEDIVACPGTDTCSLGITSSKGVARALAEVFPPGQVPDDLKGVDIKVSGCHNSCAQHHISTIGLHGVGKRIGEHVAPVYELHLGGNVDGTPKIGQMVVKLPAKNVPSAISHLIDIYRRDRTSSEGLQTFITRVGKVALKEELIPYSSNKRLKSFLLAKYQMISKAWISK